MNTPKNIIVHHSVTPRDLDNDQTEASIERNHKERFNFPSRRGKYTGYHYMIFGDGEVRQYKDHDEVGAHCKEQTMNFKSIGICLIGDFGEGEGRLDEMPSDAQIASLRDLCEKLQEEYKIPDSQIYPHRKFATYKDCWGSNLPDDIAGFIKTKEPHWSDEAMNWAVANSLLNSPRNPMEIPSWGELVVFAKRLYNLNTPRL